MTLGQMLKVELEWQWFLIRRRLRRLACRFSGHHDWKMYQCRRCGQLNPGGDVKQ